MLEGKGHAYYACNVLWMTNNVAQVIYHLEPVKTY